MIDVHLNNHIAYIHVFYGKVRDEISCLKGENDNEFVQMTEDA